MKLNGLTETGNVFFISKIKKSISVFSSLSVLSEYRYFCISKTHSFTDFNMVVLIKEFNMLVLIRNQRKTSKRVRLGNLFPHFAFPEAATGGVL